jgi:hypothetical protein
MTQDNTKPTQEQAGEPLAYTRADIAKELQEIIDNPLQPSESRLRAIELKGQLIGAFTGGNGNA